MNSYGQSRKKRIIAPSKEEPCITRYCKKIRPSTSARPRHPKIVKRILTAAETMERVLSKVQLTFIQTEFGHDPDAIGALNDEDLDSLYDRLCDIEIEETMAAGDGELSERGRMVEGIVTVIGNNLYRPEDDPDE